MKYLNEISRMQQLAGIIKEIKINSPVLLNAKIGNVKRDDNDGDTVDVDFYLGEKKIASGGGFIIHSNEFENVTVDPEIYPDFKNILNKYNIPNDNEWGLIHIPYLNDTIMRIDNSNVAGYVNDGLQEIKINNPVGINPSQKKRVLEWLNAAFDGMGEIDIHLKNQIQELLDSNKLMTKELFEKIWGMYVTRYSTGDFGADWDTFDETYSYIITGDWDSYDQFEDEEEFG